MPKFICQTVKAALSVIAAVVMLAFTGATVAAETDPESGLVIAPGWDTVKTNCTICHSAQFIIWQRGDRDTWLSMIRWMQKTQGLWELPPATENTILDYLATNYPPGQASRRKNLPPSAMPVID